MVTVPEREGLVDDSAAVLIEACLVELLEGSFVTDGVSVSVAVTECEDERDADSPSPDNVSVAERVVVISDVSSDVAVCTNVCVLRLLVIRDTVAAPKVGVNVNVFVRVLVDVISSVVEFDIVKRLSELVTVYVMESDLLWLKSGSVNVRVSVRTSETVLEAVSNPLRVALTLAESDKANVTLLVTSTVSNSV